MSLTIRQYLKVIIPIIAILFAYSNQKRSVHRLTLNKGDSYTFMSHDLFPVNETPKKQVHVESSSPAVTINPFIEGQADHGAYGSLKSESNKGYNCLSTNLDESYLTALCKLLHNENEYELLVFDRKENKLVLREDKK